MLGKENATIKNIDEIQPCAVCLKKDIDFRTWYNPNNCGNMGDDLDLYGEFECKNCGNTVKGSAYDGWHSEEALEKVLTEKWNERFSKRV